MINKGLKSSGWIFFYLTTYILFQFGYSIMATLIAEVMDGIINSQIPQAIIFAGAASLAVYLIAMRLRGKSFLEECRFNPISWSHGLASGVLGISGLAISSILLAVLSFFVDSAYLDHISNMELILGGNKLMVFISVGVIAPIVEEIIFRGLVFRELEKNLNVKAVVLVQGLLFGIYHLNLAQGVYTVFLGVVLGFALLWTKSIWAPIIIHMVNNSVSFLFSFIGVENDVLLFAVGLVLLFGIILFPVAMRYLYRTRMDKEYVNQG